MKNLNKVLIPSTSNSLTFNLIKKRFQTTLSKTNKSGYNYSMKLDSKATKLQFKSLINQIPSKAGYLIISAPNDLNKFKTIKVIHCNYNLKNKFCNQQNFLETYDYYVAILEKNNINTLNFQLAKASLKI